MQMTTNIASHQLNISQLVCSDSSDYQAFYQIYQQSLLASEQKSENEIKDMVNHPCYRIILGLLDGKVIGFSVLYVSENNAFSLLEYIAIDQMYRGQGYGSVLFRLSYEFLQHNIAASLPLVIEVDAPEKTDSPHHERIKRIRFYQQLACKTMVDLDYILPAVNALTPPKMQLMLLSPENDFVLEKNMLQLWLIDIYVHVYNRSPNDPSIEKMMCRVSDPVVLV